MGRMTFVFRRLLLLVPTALGVTIIAFFMIHLIPGDPARTILGIHATPRAIAILHQRVGPEPAARQPVLAVHGPLVHGNLGHQPVLRRAGRRPDHQPPAAHAVADLLRRRAGRVISVPLAMIAASRKDGVRDHVVRAVPLLGLGMPAFWLA